MRSVQPEDAGLCTRLMRGAGWVTLCLTLWGCSPPTPPPTDQAAPAIAATFYPTEFFASRIAGDQLDVRCPLPDDADPAEWKPTSEAIRIFQQAELIAMNGAEFEQWVKGASLPLGRLCETARPLEGRLLRFAATTHAHGPAGQHTHQGIDGHTWMDPNNARDQAEALLAAMCQRWPQHTKVFTDRFEGLAADLKALDARFIELSEQVRNVALIATHPAYNYIAARYEWKIGDLDLPPEEPPSPEALTALTALKKANEDRLIVLLFESPPHEAILKALASDPSVTPVVFTPCEMLDASDRAAGRTFLTVMHANLDALGRAVGPVAGPESSSGSAPALK